MNVIYFLRVWKFLVIIVVVVLCGGFKDIFVLYDYIVMFCFKCGLFWYSGYRIDREILVM